MTFRAQNRNPMQIKHGICIYLHVIIPLINWGRNQMADIYIYKYIYIYHSASMIWYIIQYLSSIWCKIRIPHNVLYIKCYPFFILFFFVTDAGTQMTLQRVIHKEHRDQKHNDDVIMSTMASQIISLTIVHATVYSWRRSKKTPKLRVTGLCDGNSPVTGKFPAQRASNAEMFPFDDFIMQISVNDIEVKAWLMIDTSAFKSCK